MKNTFTLTAIALTLAACSPAQGISNYNDDNDTPRVAQVDDAQAPEVVAPSEPKAKQEQPEVIVRNTAPEWKPGDPRPGDVFDPGPATGYPDGPFPGGGSGGAYDGDDGSSNPPKPPKTGGGTYDGDDGQDNPPREPGEGYNDGDGD
jgi:hypothetical protein